MNKWIGIGRLTKFPELKMTASNIPVVSFTVAVNRQYSDENGEKQADFINCVAFRKLAENLSKYCDKGSLVAVDGRISTRSYESDSGTKYVTEIMCDNIQFLDSKSDKPVKEETTDDEHYETSKQLAAEEDLPF